MASLIQWFIFSYFLVFTASKKNNLLTFFLFAHICFACPRHSQKSQLNTKPYCLECGTIRRDWPTGFVQCRVGPPDSCNEHALEMCQCVPVSWVVGSVQHCTTKPTLLPEVQLVSLPRAGLWAAGRPASRVSTAIDSISFSRDPCPDVNQMQRVETLLIHLLDVHQYKKGLLQEYSWGQRLFVLTATYLKLQTNPCIKVSYLIPFSLPVAGKQHYQPE